MFLMSQNRFFFYFPNEKNSNIKFITFCTGSGNNLFSSFFRFFQICSSSRSRTARIRNPDIKCYRYFIAVGEEACQPGPDLCLHLPLHVRELLVIQRGRGLPQAGRCKYMAYRLLVGLRPGRGDSLRFR